jgi:peptide/nickel transport system substrate-binding protein
MNQRYWLRGRARRGSTLALSALAVAISLTCGAWTTHAAHQSASKPVLIIGLESAGPLNPADNNSQTLDSIAYATILNISPTGTIEPGLATSWGYVGHGNKVFQFTLRHNARFSDGSLVTAGAVKTWLNYFPTVKGQFASSVPLQSVSTIGKWTVRMALSTADPDMPWVMGNIDLWGAIASPKAVADPTSLDSSTDGAGEYKLVPSQTVVNSDYTYVPNKYYYDQSAIKYSEVKVKIITTPTSMLQALQSGEINVAQGDASTAAAAVDGGFTVTKSPAETAGVLFLDLKSGPLANADVRKALNYAVNRKTITKAIFGKYAVPTSEFVTEDGFDAAKYQDYFPYDPSLAKKLLADAGYSHGLTLSMVTSGFAGADGTPLAEAIAQDLQAVGVTVNLTPAATATAYLDDALSGQYEMAEVSGGGTSPTWYYYEGAVASTGVYNLQHYVNPVLNNLAVEAAVAKNPANYWVQMMGSYTTQGLALEVSSIDVLYYTHDVGGVSAPIYIQGKPLVPEWYPTK